MSSFTPIRVPSIAGSCSQLFNQKFKPFITKKDDKGLPLEGSFGICYQVEESLSAAYDKVHGDRDNFIEEIMNNWDYPSRRQAGTMWEFYVWTLSDNPYFFLRKGIETIGLYQREGSYYFDSSKVNEQHKHMYCHCIRYKFVRDATNEEAKHIKGCQPDALVWASLLQPAIAPIQDTPPNLVEVVETLQGLRNQLGNITSSLDNLMASLSKKN